MILLEEHKPLITDWMIATGALAGVPLAIWGILTLFIKDKKKERQLNALEQVALAENQMLTKMQQQIDELSKQTAQFQYQSFLMLESNKLIERQIELQTAVFEHRKEFDQKKQELEDQKRRDSIRPYLTNEGSNSGPYGFTISIFNQGQDAFNLKIVPLDVQFIFPLELPDNTNLKGKNHLQLSSRVDVMKTSYTNSQVPFEVDIQFLDIDGNGYKQNIKRQNTGAVKISDPKLIETKK